MPAKPSAQRLEESPQAARSGHGVPGLRIADIPDFLNRVEELHEEPALETEEQALMSSELVCGRWTLAIDLVHRTTPAFAIIQRVNSAAPHRAARIAPMLPDRPTTIVSIGADVEKNRMPEHEFRTQHETWMDGRPTYPKHWSDDPSRYPVVALVPVGPYTDDDDIRGVWRVLVHQTIKPACVLFGFDGRPVYLPPVKEYEEHGIRQVAVEIENGPTGHPGIVRNRLLRYILEHLDELPVPFAILPMDPDDYIPPHYIERCLEGLLEDPRNAVAYGTLWQVWPEQGRQQESGILYKLTGSRWGDMGRVNWFHGCSLIRFSALLQVAGWVRGPVIDDWPTFDKMDRYGWRFVEVDTEYYWCRSSRSLTTQLQHQENSWGRDLARHYDFLTLTFPILRDTHLDALFCRISTLKPMPSPVSALFYIAIEDERTRRRVVDRCYSFAAALRPEWLCSIAVFEDGDPLDLRGVLPNRAVLERQDLEPRDRLHLLERYCGVLNRMVRLTRTPYCLNIADDIEFDPDTVLVLVDGIKNDWIDAVAPVYPIRGLNAADAWVRSGQDYLMVPPDTGGDSEVYVSGVGLDCTLFGRNLIARIPFFVADPTAPSPFIDYWRMVRQVNPKGRVLLIRHHQLGRTDQVSGARPPKRYATVRR